MPALFPFQLPFEEGSSPYDPVHDTDVLDECLARLAEQYKNKPNIAAYVGILSRRLQLLEDTAWDILTLRRITSATGAQLDVLGKIVDQPRNGLGDPDYTNCIMAKVFCNRSSGSDEDIYTVFNYVLLPGLTQGIFYQLDCAFELVISNGVLPAPWNTIFLTFLRQARMAGVRGVLRYLNSPLNQSFTFAAHGGGPGPGLGFNQGKFASAYA